MSQVTIHASTPLDAWQQGAVRLLSSQGELFNLLTIVCDPCAPSHDALLKHSPHHVRLDADNATDVSNTIFPQSVFERSGTREELYSRYLSIHDRARRMRPGKQAWGTYFERLLRFPESNVNQLERAISKLNSWPQRNTTGLVFHLSAPTVDAPRTRGGPCWHFGEILWHGDETLDLVVVYRNHDYFNKVLGNFVGLGRLLSFVCSATGKRTGKLVCHSVHAYHGSTKTQLQQLIK